MEEAFGVFSILQPAIAASDRNERAAPPTGALPGGHGVDPQAQRVCGARLSTDAQRRAVEAPGPAQVPDALSSVGAGVDTEPFDDRAAMRALPPSLSLSLSLSLWLGGMRALPAPSALVESSGQLYGTRLPRCHSAHVCLGPQNYSGWFDVDLAAQFGVISFDWANHENSYRSRPLDLAGSPVYPDDADMVTQAQMVKAKSKNKTKVFVYRQGQGLSVSFGKQAHDVLTDPAYDGAFRRRFSAHPVLARLDG